jgi:2-oxoglutarate ferredoxin oxidoreductase subunit alpha
MGIDYANAHFNPCPLPDLRVQRRDKVGDWILMDGNSACGLGAVYGGASGSGVVSHYSLHVPGRFFWKICP